MTTHIPRSRSRKYAVVLASLFVLTTVAEARPGPRAPAPGPLVQLGDKAAAQLRRVARRAGVRVQAEHTATFLRADVVLTVAPVVGTERLSAADLLGHESTTLAAAYLWTALDGVEGVPPADLYRLSARPAGGADGTPPRLDLVWTGSGGTELVATGGLQWVDDEAAPDRAATRIDLAVHAPEGAGPGAPDQYEIRIWIQLKRSRGCWVLRIPEDLLD